MRFLLPHSLRQQLLLFAVLGVSLLSMFCLPLWSAWNNEIEAGRSDLLYADAARMQEVFARHGPAELAKVIDARVGDRLDRTRQVLLLVGPDGRRITGNLNAVPATASRGHHSTLVIPIEGAKITVEVVDMALPEGYTVWVGRDISRFVRLEAMFVRGMIGSAAIALLAAAIATVAGHRATRRRVHDISRAANEIMSGNLARRLPVSQREDEFGQLADTVNRMLDQIEHLIGNVKQSSNAIAHDLRTPLAELRADLEHLALTQPSYDVVQNGLDVAIHDIDRVIGIFNAILRLAEIDSGVRRAGFRSFDVATVVGQAAELYEPLAEDSGVMLETRSQAGLLVNGDAVLLAQALANLIDNAFKYGVPPAGLAKITIDCSRASDGWIEVVVADNGPGIAKEDRDHAAHPFFRADRSRATPGVGLGMTLIAAVVRLHAGQLVLLDNGPGLRTVLRLPPV